MTYRRLGVLIGANELIELAKKYRFYYVRRRGGETNEMCIPRDAKFINIINDPKTSSVIVVFEHGGFDEVADTQHLPCVTGWMEMDFKKWLKEKEVHYKQLAKKKTEEDNERK